MYKVLSKDMIKTEIIPHLPVGKRGFVSRAPLCEIINSILYKLKTGTQWHLLPVESLFSNTVLHYKTVFGYYRRWCKSGLWKHCWCKILDKHHANLDLSSSDLDGSHTRTLRGGEEVGHHTRKRQKSTNALYLTDRQGLPLAMSFPVAGNHNDLYQIEAQLDEIFDTLKEAKIPIDGLFLNADKGFDTKTYRKWCEQRGIFANTPYNKRRGEKDHYNLVDELLYKERYAIERTNAWMDSFRSILNRFDITLTSWIGFNYLAFIVLGLKKFYKKKKSR